MIQAQTDPRPGQFPAKARRFFRSIRLERDFGDAGALEGYTVTPQVRQVLARLEAGIRADGTERAFTLTGPYGSGKSAFALFLARLLEAPGGQRNPAVGLLREADRPQAERFAEALPGGLVPVVLTLRRAPLALALKEGLLEAARRFSNAPGKALVKALEDDLAAATTDTRTLLRHVEALHGLALQGRKHQGVLLILDELGKALEYAARHPGEDIYLLQELAEAASRSGESPLVVIGVLHQAFEQYGEHLDLSARKEWAKVQGRYSDIAFLEPPEQQMRLVAQAMALLGLGDPEGQAQLRGIAEELCAAGYGPRGMRPEEFAALAGQSYPLHPAVLAALPHLFRRFAQNERSLFAYLLSHEPFGLQDLLQQGREDLVRLADLFDYFMANLGGSLVRQTLARRWLEVVDVLERSPDLALPQVEVVKTVGLLGILGDVSPLSASQDLIALAMADRGGDGGVAEVLIGLRARSLLTYRLYNDTYRVWEGSDVDLEVELETGRRKTQGQGLAESLQRFLPNRPVVARRHSHQTGALRFFEVRYLDAPSATPPTPGGGADGVLACCLPETLEGAEGFARWAQGLSGPKAAHLVVVLPRQIGTLREAAAELRALRWVWDNTPALRDDRVARKELAERIAQVEQALTGAVGVLLDPRPEPLGSSAQWFHGSEAPSAAAPRDAAQLLSRVMDGLYPASPRVRNELINRRSLSSAAAAARRSLIEMMLTHPAEPLLGMEGYPPERSMYESVLLATGLHRLEGTAWRFGEPPEDDPHNLRAAWALIHGRVFGALDAPYPVNKLFLELSVPPLGVMPGVQPVLLAAFLLAHADETSLYRDGVFVPEPAPADFEVLLRRPELFAVAGGRIAGERKALVERLSAGLKVRPALVPVVRALVRMVRSVPESAWRTRKLPEEVLELREAFDRAKAPELLLFSDIPRALGEKPFSDQEAKSAKRIETFFNKLNSALQTWGAFAPGQVEQARDTLLTVCQLPAGEKGWASLREQAKRLAGKPIQAALVPFVNRLNAPGEERAVLEGVLALVASRPPKGWTDTDIERFPSQAEVIGERFVQAVQLLGVLTPEEEAESDKLAEKLRKSLNLNMPPHVLRAALAKLLQDL